MEKMYEEFQLCIKASNDKLQKQSEEFQSIISDLKTQLTERVANLEHEHLKLKEQYFSVCKENSELKKSVNQREQYARLNSIRIDGMEVSQDLVKEAGPVYACMHTAYNKIIKPVLLKAVNPDGATWKKGRARLSDVPKMTELLSNGHFVFSGEVKKTIPTVIIRFTSRFYRNLFLQLRRQHMPKPNSAEVAKSGKAFYAAYPDLTRTHFKFLRSLKEDQRVHSAWAFECKLRFKLHADVKSGNLKHYYETDDVFKPVYDAIVDAVKKKPPPAVSPRHPPSRKPGVSGRSMPPSALPPNTDNSQLPNADDARMNLFPHEFIESSQ